MTPRGFEPLFLSADGFLILAALAAGLALVACGCLERSSRPLRPTAGVRAIIHGARQGPNRARSTARTRTVASSPPSGPAGAEALSPVPRRCRSAWTRPAESRRNVIRPADSFEASPLPAAATPRALVVARARRPDNEQPRPTQDGRDTALGPHDEQVFPSPMPPAKVLPPPEFSVEGIALHARQNHETCLAAARPPRPKIR